MPTGRSLLLLTLRPLGLGWRQLVRTPLLPPHPRHQWRRLLALQCLLAELLCLHTGWLHLRPQLLRLRPQLLRLRPQLLPLRPQLLHLCAAWLHLRAMLLHLRPGQRAPLLRRLHLLAR